jgi:hypothetical protein
MTNVTIDIKFGNGKFSIMNLELSKRNVNIKDY